MTDTTAALAALEAARAERKAKLANAEAEQRLADLLAIDRLEQEHGDSNVAVLESPFTAGLPVMLAVRVPNRAELKRYRDMLKPDKQGRSDAVAAAILIGKACLIYPAPDVFDAVLEARPGVDVQLGVAAVNLAAARASEEGKG